MKELGYDHYAFSNEPTDLGHCSYKGLLTSQRERWLDVTCSQMKNMLRTPAAGVKGLSLNVIKKPHPTPDFQEVQRGKEHATGLHRDAINKLWEALQDKWPGFFNRHKEKKQRCQEATDKKSSGSKVEASVWTFLPPANPLPTPGCLSPLPQGPCLRYPWAPAEAQALRGGPCGSFSGQGSSDRHTWPHTQGSFSGSFINSHRGLELPETSLHRTLCSLSLPQHLNTVFRVKLPFCILRSLSFPVNTHLQSWKTPAPPTLAEMPLAS